MSKLRLLQKLIKDGLVARLTREELHLFLLMVAASNECGEGEMLPGQLRQVLGNDFSLKGLKEIFAGLEEKCLVVIKPNQWYCTKRCSLVVAYRIILPGYSGLNDGETNVVLKFDKAKSG